MTAPPPSAATTDVTKAEARRTWFLRRRLRLGDASLKEVPELGDPRVEDDWDRSSGVSVLSVDDDDVAVAMAGDQGTSGRPSQTNRGGRVYYVVNGNAVTLP